MAKKIYLTENQFDALMESQMLNESFSSILEKVAAGILSVYVACAMVRGCHSLDDAHKEQMIQQIEHVAQANGAQQANPLDTVAAQATPVQKPVVDGDWRRISNEAIVTVYNAKPEQCNADVQHTASMFRLNLDAPESHRIVALERTFMQKNDIKFGDLIMIKGTYKGRQDGVYQVQDLMNKRFAGMDKVDILVDNNTKYGGTAKNEHAEIYVLNDKTADDSQYRVDMAPQMAKINVNENKSLSMKMNVSRQELDECIANAVTNILKEYEIDPFGDDDMLDALVDDPELRAALGDKKAKKAKKAAKAQGEKEMTDAEKDDEKAAEEEFIDNSNVDTEEDFEDNDSEEENADDNMNLALMQQAADAETDPMFKRCIEAGIPVKELYTVKRGKAYHQNISEPDLEWMANHPDFGRKPDPNSSLAIQLGSSGDADRMKTDFRMKGAPINKKKAQLAGKYIPDDYEEDESNYSYYRG